MCGLLCRQKNAEIKRALKRGICCLNIIASPSLLSVTHNSLLTEKGGRKKKTSFFFSSLFLSLVSFALRMDVHSNAAVSGNLAEDFLPCDNMVSASSQWGVFLFSVKGGIFPSFFHGGFPHFMFVSSNIKANGFVSL